MSLTTLNINGTFCGRRCTVRTRCTPFWATTGGGGGICTGNFSHEKISRRVYFA